MDFDSAYEVDPVTGCWVWQRARMSDGYGVLWADKKVTYAHRYSYIQARGPIPDGLVLDHLCRNRPCVNPDHLEAVSLDENTRRGESGYWKKELTHCSKGHELPPIAANGRRVCKICHRARNQEYRMGILQREKVKPMPVAMQNALSLCYSLRDILELYAQEPDVEMLEPLREMLPTGPALLGPLEALKTEDSEAIPAIRGIRVWLSQLLRQTISILKPSA